VAGKGELLRSLRLLTDPDLFSLELEELLAALLGRVHDVLAVDTCAVLLLDEGRDELVARAAVGIEEEVEQGVRIPMGRGFAGRVAAGRRPVILDDVDHADVVNPLLRQKGIKSLLGVPLLAGGNAIGVLHVGSLARRGFTDDDVELLELVAARVALAVERGWLHEQTTELDELRSNFVAIASHELRTPASSVYGVFATLVGREELPPEMQKRLIRVGYEQADRLRRLIEQLLDLSQLDAQRVPIKPSALVLRSSLAEIVDAVAPQPDAVRLEVPESLAAFADPLALDRVLSNLLVNAFRYGQPPIVVAAERSDRHLRVTVSDSGAGVPERLQPHLFERFTRSEDATGSGLGLTIARAYARAHGGELILVPGAGGARFELIIPQD
jgi:signal transduction histidine kinase